MDYRKKLLLALDTVLEKKDILLSFYFIAELYHNDYNFLNTELKIYFTKEQESYPDALVEAYNLEKTDSQGEVTEIINRIHGKLAFAQTNNGVSEKKGNNK